MAETRPNWKERDGEVLPSYTGSNAPIYHHTSENERLEELEDIHPQFSRTGAHEVDVNQIRADLRGQLHTEPHDPERKYLENATPIYVDGRKDILG